MARARSNGQAPKQASGNTTDRSAGFPGTLQKHWKWLSATAAWIVSVVSSALLPLSIGILDADTTAITKFAGVLCAITVAILFVLAQVFEKSGNNYSKIWGVVAIVFLAATGVAMDYNYNLAFGNCCTDPKKNIRIIKGTELTLEAKGEPGLTPDYCRYLFIEKPGKQTAKPEDIWTTVSIGQVRSKLFQSYIICFPLFSVGIFSFARAIKGQPIPPLDSSEHRTGTERSDEEHNDKGKQLGSTAEQSSEQSGKDNIQPTEPAVDEK